MKKIARIASLILTAAILLAAIPFSATAADNLSGKTIIAFGDSLTEGTVWWVNNGYDVYTDHLADNFPNSTIINAGQRGDSTYNASLRFETEVLNKNPDIVIICFGMNDQAWEVQYNRPIIPLYNYRMHLENFTKALQNIGADVIFMTPNPVYEAAYTPTASNNYEYGLMDDYCNEMREIAIEYGCGLIDVNYEFNSRTVSTLVSSDGIHQTIAGHKLYGDLITAYLNAVYNGSSKATATVNCVDENGRIIKTVSHSGASGAKITLAVPEIDGFTANSDTAPIETSLVNGGVHTMKYTSELSAVLAKARRISVRDYSEHALAELRSVCAEAASLLSASTADASAMNACAVKLNALLALAGETETVVSKGASYTATAPNRGDAYDNDGKRLTDGIKGGANGGTAEYAGWNAGNVEVTVDLGALTETNYYRAYVAGGAWGIGEARTLGVQVSADGVSFTKLSESNTVTELAAHDSTAEPWKSYALTVKTDSVQNARYVKFVIGGCAYNSFVWVSEVEAAMSRPLITDKIDIYGFNSSIQAGDAFIFTPDHSPLTDSNSNLRYTYNIVAKLNSAGDYIITEIYANNTNTTNAKALSEGEILVAVHGDPSVENSQDNKEEALKAAIGQKLVFDNIDIESKTLGIGANISLTTAYAIGDINADGAVGPIDYMLLKRYCLNTLKLTEEQLARCDINGDSAVGPVDYMLLKRICLGTFKL